MHAVEGYQKCDTNKLTLNVWWLFTKIILNKTYLYILINSLVWREICSLSYMTFYIVVWQLWLLTQFLNALIIFCPQTVSVTWIILSHSCVPSMLFLSPSDSWNPSHICICPTLCFAIDCVSCVCGGLLCTVWVLWVLCLPACHLLFDWVSVFSRLVFRLYLGGRKMYPHYIFADTLGAFSVIRSKCPLRQAVEMTPGLVSDLKRSI